MAYNIVLVIFHFSLCSADAHKEWSYLKFILFVQLVLLLSHWIQPYTLQSQVMVQSINFVEGSYQAKTSNASHKYVKVVPNIRGKFFLWFEDWDNLNLDCMWDLDQQNRTIFCDCISLYCKHFLRLICVELSMPSNDKTGCWVRLIFQPKSNGEGN